MTPNFWENALFAEKTVFRYLQKDRNVVEEELVRVRGLISIVFDLSKSRVTCRVKRDLGIDKLIGAVSKTDNFRAKQIVNGPDGEEVSDSSKILL